jgi:phosphoribosylanthranilate isomerase
MAIEAGASAIGLVSAMPSGPGPIPEELIAEIAATVPPGVSSFLLTCLQDVEEIIDQQRRLRVNTIQICDRLTRGSYWQLREALPYTSPVPSLSRRHGRSHRTSMRCCWIQAISRWRLRSLAERVEHTTGT